jgi:hypothetical protein
MVEFKKLAASTLCVAIAFGCASAFALNVGDSGTLTDMQNKLAGENLVEIAYAVTAGNQTVLGVKFYYNQISKVGYVVLTNDPDHATQMRIVLKTTDTDFSGPVVVPQPQAGIQECKQLIAQQRAKEDDCGSLYSTMKAGQDLGRLFFQQGRQSNGNTLVTIINTFRGDGTVYESTPNGATTSKLSFGGVRCTEKGALIIPSSSCKP